MRWKSNWLFCSRNCEKWLQNGKCFLSRCRKQQVVAIATWPDSTFALFLVGKSLFPCQRAVCPVGGANKHMRAKSVTHWSWLSLLNCTWAQNAGVTSRWRWADPALQGVLVWEIRLECSTSTHPEKMEYTNKAQKRKRSSISRSKVNWKSHWISFTPRNLIVFNLIYL